MSSVTRFIRQIPVSTTYYSASAIVSSPSTLAFELVPSVGNIIGNYPPGTMSTNVSALNSRIAAAVSSAGGAANVMLRDMGKTVRAALTSDTTKVGFFRQVQLIAPAPITSYIGGSDGSNFGVVAGADAYTAYLTFYIPIAALGASAVAAVPVHGACQQ
jgi:hypothetical protein